MSGGFQKVYSHIVENSKTFIDLKKRLRECEQSTPQKKDKDGHFVLYDNGVVYDTQNGLEWYIGPDEDINWEKAKSWVDNFSRYGGGWRMPSINELYKLYNPDWGSRNMTRLIKTSGWNVWSGDMRKNSFSVKIGIFLSFRDAGTKSYRGNSFETRVFAVRPKKQSVDNKKS